MPFWCAFFAYILKQTIYDKNIFMALKVWLPLNKDLRNVGLNNDIPITTVGDASFIDNMSPSGNKAVLLRSNTGRIQLNNFAITMRNASELSICIFAYPYVSTNQLIFSLWRSYFAFTIWNNAFWLRTASTGDNGTGQKLTDLPSIEPNKWTHYACTFNRGTTKIYINGEFYTSGKTVDNDVMLSTLDKFYIGNYTSPYFYSGCTCDFRAYDNELSEKDIKRIYQQKLFELIPYSGVKDVLFDRSGFMIMPLVNSNAVFQNNALYFNGTNAMLRPKNGNVGFTMDDGTLSVWFTIETSSKSYQIIYIDSVSNFAIGYSTSTKVLYTTCVTSKTGFNSDLVKFDGSINNIIVSYNTGKTPNFMLVNGINASTSGNSNWTETSGLTIGSRMYNTANSSLKGKIFKVGVYNRQFTQDEALELYNSEHGMFLPDDYIQLEYIQSDGNQWIDTEISGETRWVGCGQSVQTTTKSQALLITRNGGSVGTFIGSVSNGNKWTVKGSPYSTSYDITSKQNFDVLFKTTGPSGNIGYTDVTITTSCTLNTNWIICCERVTTYPYIGKIWQLKAYQNNLIVRNFIPAKRKSDNVIGMYDMISKQFFTNSGTGSFTGA